MQDEGRQTASGKWGPIAGGVLVIFLAIVAVGLIMSQCGSSNASARQTKANAQQQIDCGPTSSTPCTEREARFLEQQKLVKLQAEVDSFAKPTGQKHLDLIKKYEQQVFDAKLAEHIAKAEKEKYEWFVQNLKQQQKDKKSEKKALPCDTTPWTRGVCNELRN